jgi:hypothetical protein
MIYFSSLNEMLKDVNVPSEAMHWDASSKNFNVFIIDILGLVLIFLIGIRLNY